MTDLAPLLPAAGELVRLCAARGLKIATAESCTGGLVAAAITEISGSSAVFDRGFVTYSNAAKVELLGIPVALINRVGAVSEEVSRAMAEGALDHSRADIAVAITGVAGPTGGTAERPVGLVHFSAMRRGQPARHVKRHFEDRGRSAIRLAAADQALAMLLALASQTTP